MPFGGRGESLIIGWFGIHGMNRHVYAKTGGGGMQLRSSLEAYKPYEQCTPTSWLFVSFATPPRLDSAESWPRMLPMRNPGTILNA